ncbi:MAG: phosphoribosyltransferase family protein [Woeseiaceae bacterium]|nr:phosphoribosyltransferase family protein [Woeseiaceae bacterium]
MKKTIIKRIRKAQGTAEDRSAWDKVLISMYHRFQRIKDKFRNSNSDHISKVYLRTRNLKRNLKGKKVKFVTVDQASIWTLEWIQTLPRRYDLIVGVPRSGMFVASLMALKLGKGLTTPDLLQQGKYWHSGQVKEKLALDGTNHVLIVDDSMDSGRSMARAVDLIRAVNDEIEISRACLVIREEARNKVDLYHKIIAPPRTFEWNILHRKIASHFGHGRLAIDMDGVLCAECPAGADDDEQAYLDWLSGARPYLIPAFEIDAIVTCRLERYRQQTEEWLRKQNVRYKELHMWDVPSKSDRRGRFARHKVDTLLHIKPDMFWESNWDQSNTIWNETRIPTLCIEKMTLLS